MSPSSFLGPDALLVADSSVVGEPDRECSA